MNVDEILAAEDEDEEVIYENGTHDNNEDSGSNSSNNNHKHSSVSGNDDDDDDESGSSASSSDDDEDDEEVEEEPKLKYQRMGSSIPNILKEDTANCFCVHDKFLVMGTHKGRLHVLDVSGNEIHRYDTHKAPVNSVSIDDAGEYMASSSDDGTVVITNLYSHEISTHSYHRAVNSVAIHPQYEQKIMFATGGLNQQLILNTKGWFSTKDNVIHAGEGPIYAIAWRNSLIAWANDEGVKVYDVATQERICHVGRPKSSPPPSAYKCHLCWAGTNEDRLIVAWADFIRVGVIRTRSVHPSSSQSSTKDVLSLKIVKPREVRYMAIISNIQTDFWIAGVAPYGNNLVLLAYIDPDISMTNEDDTTTTTTTTTRNNNNNIIYERPELRIISQTNEDIACDALPILGYERYVCTDYHLEYMGGDEPLFYVISPKDIVVARPRDADDRITWLLSHERYKDALDAAENNKTLLKHHEYLDIGEKYLKYLMDEGEYELAASNCNKLLKDNPKLWETWIYVFAKYRQLNAISAHIPIVDPQLDSTLYEMVLSQFIVSDHDGLLYTIRKWPHHIYNVPTVITAILHRLRELKDEESNILLDALGDLYLMDRQYDRALQVYLKLQRKDVFELVKRLDLIDSVRNRALSLMMFDAQRAVELFVSERERIPVDDVVSQLNNHRKLLHTYLNALYEVDNQAGHRYHQFQVSLYAEYEPTKLLAFLRTSHHYILEDALKICRDNQLYREEVFILKRMGNTSDALNLIIEKLLDVQHAIEFVEEQKDDQLWESLISHSLAEPKLLSDLLKHVGSHYVDPLRLIRRIPRDMEVPDLKMKLKKILDDQTLQVSLRQGCNNILQGDVVALMVKHCYERKRGVKAIPIDKCLVCNGVISIGSSESVTIFFCKHSYHTDCIKNQRVDRRQKTRCIHPNCQYGKYMKHNKKQLPKPPKVLNSPSKNRMISRTRTDRTASVYFTAAKQSPEKSRNKQINVFTKFGQS